MSVTAGLDGLTLTSLMLGGVLSIVTLSLALFPSSTPSLAVTSQVTLSPPTNAPERVLAVPALAPLTVQA